MTDLIYNHITVRVPGTEHRLMNLCGLLYKEITASSLAKIDLDGNVLWKPDTDYGLRRAATPATSTTPPSAGEWWVRLISTEAS